VQDRTEVARKIHPNNLWLSFSFVTNHGQRMAEGPELQRYIGCVCASVSHRVRRVI